MKHGGWVSDEVGRLTISLSDGAQRGFAGAKKVVSPSKMSESTTSRVTEGALSPSGVVTTHADAGNQSDGTVRHRVHRKKKADATPEIMHSAVVALASKRSHKSTTSPCLRCTKALTIIERMRIANESYRDTCEYLIEQVKDYSPCHSRARDVITSTATLASYAMKDAQTLLRGLVCGEGCILIPNLDLRSTSVSVSCTSS